MRISEVPFDELLPWPMDDAQLQMVLGLNELMSDTDRLVGNELGWGYEAGPQERALWSYPVHVCGATLVVEVVNPGPEFDRDRLRVQVRVRLELAAEVQDTHDMHRTEMMWEAHDAATFVAAWARVHAMIRQWRNAADFPDAWYLQAWGDGVA